MSIAKFMVWPVALTRRCKRFSANAASTTYTLPLTIGTDISTISVYGFVNPTFHAATGALSIAEIFIQ